MRQGLRTESAHIAHGLVKARPYAAACHCGAARWKLPAAREGRRREGIGAVGAGIQAHADVALRIFGDMGWQPDPDDAPGWSVRPRPPIRHLLVHRRDPQVPAPLERSTGHLVLPAAVRSGLTALFPGRHRQSVGAPRSDDPRCVDRRPVGDLGVRNDARRPAHLFVRTHHEPNRCRARCASVPPPAGASDGLLPGTPRRRFSRARARTGEHPQFPHQLGPDSGHRPFLHAGIHRRAVLVLPAAHVDRRRRNSALRRDLGRRHTAVPAAAR